MELVRQKNIATVIVFPIVDTNGDTVTGAADLDSEIDTWSDVVVPDGFVDCTNEATEIGTTGIYYLSLTQAEMNNDYICIRVQTSTAGANTQHVLIRTMVGNPLNIAITNDGGVINDISTTEVQSSCDAAITANVNVNSINAGVNNLEIRVPDVISLANINAEVDSALDTAIPGSPVADSINERIKAIDDKLPTGIISDFDESADTVNLSVASETQIDAIEIDTNALNDVKIPQTLNLTALGNVGIDWANVENPATVVGLSGTIVKTATDVETDTTDIQTQIGIAGAGLTGLGGMSTGMKAEVNTEVVDVIKIDTVSEMSQGVLPASPTIEEILNYLYRLLRNKIETTATEIALYDNAGTTKLIKAVLADDAITFTRNEFGSGA